MTRLWRKEKCIEATGDAITVSLLDSNGSLLPSAVKQRPLYDEGEEQPAFAAPSDDNATVTVKPRSYIVVLTDM